MSLSRKLELIRKGYSQVFDNGYDAHWHRTGERRVNEVPIFDEDFEIEGWFVGRATNVQKSVRLEGRGIHTRLMSMTIYNRHTGEFETLEYNKLVELYEEETGATV